MELWSDAIEGGGQIPERYTKNGENLSPPLRWSDVPEGTRELALLVEDETGGGPPVAQWIVYGIPPDADRLPEGFRHTRDPTEPLDVLQGTNAIENVGYDGPLGAVGLKLRWRFRLFALSEPLDLEPGADRERLLDAVEGKVLEEADFNAIYRRPRS